MIFLFNGSPWYKTCKLTGAALDVTLMAKATSSQTADTALIQGRASAWRQIESTQNVLHGMTRACTANTHARSTRFASINW